MKAVTIKVLPRHIEGADRSAHNSPIARAIVDATKTPKRVHVWHNRVRFLDAAGCACYELPPAASRADQLFSISGALEPFEFELNRVPVDCYALEKPAPHLDPENSTDGPKSSQSGPTSRRQLNPKFVEWLQGIPEDWTLIESTDCASAETE